MSTGAIPAGVERALRLMRAADEIALGKEPSTPLRPEDWAELGFQTALIAACRRRQQHAEQLSAKAVKFDGMLDLAAAIGTKRP